MPLTPTYDLPYPPLDLSSTANVPEDLEALASATDAALGVIDASVADLDAGKSDTGHGHADYALGYMDAQSGSDVTSTVSPSAYTASKTVTLTAGRRYKVTAKWKFRNSSGTDTGCGADVKFYGGSAGADLLQVAPGWVEGNALSQQVYDSLWFIYTGSGNETFRMLLDRTSANGIATMEDVSWILEDIGNV
jgi:hypothetical protein